MPPLILIALAWLGGLVIAHHVLVPLGVEPVQLILLGLIPLGSILLWRKDRAIRLGGLCALALLAGALRYETHLPNPDDPGFVAYYNDQGWVTVEGVVQGYPDERDAHTNLRLEVEALEIDGQARAVQGTVLVYAPRYPEVGYGDRLRVSGLLETPPEFEDFSYRDYLARQGIYAVIYGPQITRVASGQGSPFWAALYAVKDRARDVIAQLVPEPEASLLQGILLGIESGIPAELYEAYNTTGTSHIIVISGSNITILAALFALTFGRLLGKRRAYWFTMAGIVVYVLLVGADAAVVRAGVMGGLFVTALYLGRRSSAYVSLLASAIVLTAINPLALWDAGFQLSFAATLSLILFTPATERFFERGLTRFIAADRARTALRYLNDVLIVTLAAQVLALPLIVYHFGRLSLVSPLANLLILPVQPPIMALGGAATLVGLLPFLEPVAQVIYWAPWLALAYTNAVVRWLASVPFASLEIGRGGAWWLILYYGALAAGAWLWRQRRTQERPAVKWAPGRRTATLALGVPLVAALLAWLAVFQLPDGRLHVAFLDIGQGDAILLTTPGGQQILIDGGPSPTALISALGEQMPFWDRSLDLVIMTHPDADHVTGLAEALDRFRVEGWLDNGQPDDDATYAKCLALVEEKGITRHAVQAGDRLDLGQGLFLEVLHPPAEPIVGTESDSNNNSLVLRLTWGEASFLFTGDIEARVEGLLVDSGQPLAADVLKVSHHGSGGASTEEFLDATDPDQAIISAGAGNRFGHPHPDVLGRLLQRGDVTVLRTDEQGTIEFVSNGRQMWIETEH